LNSLAAILVLISAFLHALWNTALKLQKDPESAAVAILGISTIFAVLAVPFMGGPSFPSIHGLFWALGAGVCEGGYFVTLALAMRRSPLGIVYTVSRGGSIVAVWPLSIIFLGEPITFISAGGTLLVACGIILTSADSDDSKEAGQGISWAVLCALFISGYHLCYKCSLSTGANPSVVFAAALGLALPINIIRFGREGLSRTAKAIREKPFVLVVSGAICTASFLVFLIALSHSGAGIVLTLRNTSVIFTMLLAWRIGEIPGTRRIAGTIAVAAGAILLGWPA